ncbi:MAG: rhamnulokinase [Clostridia bacterium]|nr:rhamnulokinase [Clostridia bacterium]
MLNEVLVLKKVLAIDFGASSGRAILGSFDGKKIDLTEVHRFSNDPNYENGELRWNAAQLFEEIKTGIKKAKEVSDFDSIAIDTWGVDYGIIDKDGNLVANPYNYRDSRTDNAPEEAFKVIPEKELYAMTGIQVMNFNTLFQLLVEKDLDKAETILMMPDLFGYMLTGEKYCESTICSTSHMFDHKNCDWNWEVIDRFGYPRSIFPPVVKAGTVVGTMKKDLADELGVEPKEVIAIGAHDTASAVAAVPSKEKDFIFISCGTWSLFGTVTDEPVISEKSNKYNITNEYGFGGKIRFLRNIIGLWLIQEAKRQFVKDGKNYSYGDMEELALKSEPFKYLIDPDDPVFVPPGGMLDRICDYCEKTGQGRPQTDGEIVRCIYESIALKYRNSFEKIIDCTGKEYNSIHMVGGGTKDKLLCQMTANSTGAKVIAGPIEATALGNIAVQLYAKEVISDLTEVIMNSAEIKEYNTQDKDVWDKAYQKFLNIID